jgi:hypothetical protein
MACPKCGCKVSYQFDGDNSDECRGDDERLERCAACRHVFDIEDSADEGDSELPGMWTRGDFEGGPPPEIRGPDWKRPAGVQGNQGAQHD